jgi:hypothetical protein
LGRLQASETRRHRFAQLLAEFASYLEEEKGLAPRTIITRSWVAKDFLYRALQPKRALHEITIRQIDEVLAHKGTEGGYSRRGIQSYASGLRPFFRYAEQQNLCRRGLADAIRAPRVYRNETLPGCKAEAKSHAAANHSNLTGRRSVHAGPPAPSERPPSRLQSPVILKVDSFRCEKKLPTNSIGLPPTPHQNRPFTVRFSAL